MPASKKTIIDMAGPSPQDRVERMMTEITLGIPRSRSRAVRKGNKDDIATWNRLEADIAKISSQGGIVDYGIGHKPGQ